VVVALLINGTGGIYTATAISRRYGDSTSYAATALGLGEDVTSENLVDTVLDKQFPAVFRHTASGLLWISFVFAAYFICNDYHERGFEALFTHGASKRTVFWSKWLSCLVAFWLTAMVILLIMLLRYTALSHQPAELILRNLLLYSLMILSYGAQCAMIAFICRNTLWTAGVCFAVTVLQNFSPITHPMQILQYENLWKADGSAALFSTAIISSLVLLAGATVIARVCFQCMELKREV
jgi:ABC-type transport system involved in multi-copper enzyme maturation permease subunit